MFSEGVYNLKLQLDLGRTFKFQNDACKESCDVKAANLFTQPYSKQSFMSLGLWWSMLCYVISPDGKMNHLQPTVFYRTIFSHASCDTPHSIAKVTFVRGSSEGSAYCTMPTIAVDKAALFKELGREYVQLSKHRWGAVTLMLSRYTTEEFDELCFDYGKCYYEKAWSERPAKRT